MKGEARVYIEKAEVYDWFRFKNNNPSVFKPSALSHTGVLKRTGKNFYGAMLALQDEKITMLSTFINPFVK